MRRVVGVAAALAAAVAALLLGAPAASAHPLGNFTVSRHAGLVLTPAEVRLTHVQDVAEIPTAARVPEIDSSGDGTTSPGELADWAADACAGASTDLRLSVDGKPVDLSVESATATTDAGQAGLPVLRVECDLAGAVRITGTSRVTFEDRAGSGDAGWKEVVARGDGVRLLDSDVPDVSPSAVLRTYPRDLLTDTPDVRTADLLVRPGAGAAAAGPMGYASDGTGVVAWLADAFADLVDAADDNVLTQVLAILAAVLFGAAHAVAPGHGKSVMAFYLAGRRGGLRSAAAVGATVTATHTAGVLLLGLLVATGAAVAPGSLYPWLATASGVLVVTLGLALLRSRRSGHHHHGGAHHHHPHDGHDHGGHDHHHHQETAVTRGGTTLLAARADGAPSNENAAVPAPLRELVALGLVGGLLPSPSALLVFLGALGLGHPWYGVLLVLAFGAGMAVTLAGVGLLASRLTGRLADRLRHRPTALARRALRVAPTASGIAVVGVGVLLTVRGIVGSGML